MFGGGILDFIRQRRSTPLIGAVHGAAMAGGFEIALACDLLVAAEGTRLGLPEVTVGLVAGAGGVAHLPRRIPAAIVREMALTGTPITAERAFAAGLVNRVVPMDELLPTAMSLAETIAANAPLAVAASKRIIDAALRGDPGLDRLNDEELRRVMASEDAREGALAFRARRAPGWKGA